MILDNIVKSTALRLAKIKENFDYPFEKALRKDDISFICEIKKASPSKGVIDEEFAFLDIATDYEQAGADAISVLTEPEYFLGDPKHLVSISNIVKIPTLRKDFIIDPYQIYEAKILGASAILLISEILDITTLTSFIKLAENLGMNALVESHSKEALKKALLAGASILGVNNRDLQTFHVDIETSLRLRDMVSLDKIFVSESGITTNKDVENLRIAGVNAVLIGETLMKSINKRAKLLELRGKQ